MRRHITHYKEAKELKQPYSKQFQDKKQAERFVSGLSSHNLTYTGFYIHENPINETVWLYINGLKKS